MHKHVVFVPVDVYFLCGSHGQRILEVRCHVIVRVLASCFAKIRKERERMNLRAIVNRNAIIHGRRRPSCGTNTNWRKKFEKICITCQEPSVNWNDASFNITWPTGRYVVRGFPYGWNSP